MDQAEQNRRRTILRRQLLDLHQADREFFEEIEDLPREADRCIGCGRAVTLARHDPDLWRKGYGMRCSNCFPQDVRLKQDGDFEADDHSHDVTGHDQVVELSHRPTEPRKIDVLVWDQVYVIPFGYRLTVTRDQDGYTIAELEPAQEGRA